MVISGILMGAAVVLFGVAMLAKPQWFKSFSKARLKAHGGLEKKAEATWQRWHRRSAVFCILAGLVMVIGGAVRVFGQGDPFDPRATPTQALSAFSMDCAADQVALRNRYTDPIWIRLSYPTVFGAAQMLGETVEREDLEGGGWLFEEPVADSHKVALRASEVIHLQVAQQVKMPLFGLSSADCGGGVDSLALSPKERELRLENLQAASSHCNRLQVQVALYNDPESPPSFVGWRACVIRH